MSTRAWRATIRCSRAFSSAIAAWATSVAAVRRCSTVKPRPERVSVPKLWRPAVSGSSKRLAALGERSRLDDLAAEADDDACRSRRSSRPRSRRSRAAAGRRHASRRAPRRSGRSRRACALARRPSSSSRASSWSAISLKASAEACELVAALAPRRGGRAGRGRSRSRRWRGRSSDGHDRAADDVGDERDQRAARRAGRSAGAGRRRDGVVDLVLRRRAARAPGCRFLRWGWWRACGSGCRSTGTVRALPGGASAAPVSARRASDDPALARARRAGRSSRARSGCAGARATPSERDAGDERAGRRCRC